MGKLSPGGKYGPPPYDYSRKAKLARRKRMQSLRGKPVAMYSSKWQDFGKYYLRGNPYINQKLRKLATRAMFQLRAEIPIGDKWEDGHLRYQIKIEKARGGYRKDRDVYMVGGFSSSKTNREKWNAAVKRSSYLSKEDWNAALSAGGRAPYGPRKSWINSAADKVNRRG